MNMHKILGLELDMSTPTKPNTTNANTATNANEPGELNRIDDYENDEPTVDVSLNISGIEEQVHYQCTNCPYNTKDKSNFNKHIQNVKCSSEKVVPTSNTFMCHRCTKEYKTKYGLNLHLKKHDENFKYTCDTCRKAFNQMSSFKGHLTSHTKALGAKCSTCKEYFSTPGSLKRHQQTSCTNSKNMKAFQCEKCPAEFSRKYSLLYHARAAHSSYRYMCDQCGKGFLWRSSLKSLKKTHS